ncbi:MAG: hypothetical protein AB2A00_11475 [Myxococcota bacterium]
MPPSTQLPTRLSHDAVVARERMKSRAEELLAHIARNMAAITESFFEIGEALAELANNRMHVALGYRSFEEMLADRRLLSDVQARKLIAVATHVPREAAVRLGPERSYLLTRYAHAQAQPSVRALLRSGDIDGHAIEDLSVRELAELTRRVRERAPRGKKRPERAVARQAQARLRKAGLSSAVVTPVRRQGGPVYRLELDEDALQRLLRRL